MSKVKGDKLIGKKLGCSTFLERIPDPKRKNVLYLARCEATGRERIVFKSNFIRKGSEYRCEECSWDNRRKYENSALGQLYIGYIGSARIRNLPFHISYDDFCFLVSQQCHYCGAEPRNIKRPKSRETKSNSAQANGLDRIINNLGYFISNVVPCCSTCNRARMDIPYLNFLIHLQRIAIHQGWVRKGGAWN